MSLYILDNYVRYKWGYSCYFLCSGCILYYKSFSQYFTILFSFSALKCCITIENPPNEESKENLVSYGETKTPEDIPSAEQRLNNNFNSEKKKLN